MNKKNIALMSAIGFASAGLALMPASAEAPQTIAKLPGSSCAVGGKCFSGPKGMDFSDEQLEKLSSLKTKAQEASGPTKLELKKLRHDLMDKLTKGDVNKKELLQIQSKINSLKSELANSRISFMVDASAILTPEQKQKMRRKMLMKNLMGGKHHGKKRWHGKKFHGKRLKKMKAGAGVDSSVTTQAENAEIEKELG